MWYLRASFFFFFNDTATTEIYTLSLHDALPICAGVTRQSERPEPSGKGFSVKETEKKPTRSARRYVLALPVQLACGSGLTRSEEHTSELQSQSNLVCRLLLEKKKNTKL